MNLVVISDNKAYRYVNGVIDQICEIQASKSIKEDIEYFRVNGLEL
jgi:hypothetical protein